MLIEQYELELFTPHCSPGSETFAATAHLTADIREVLPYLNATLPGASYSPGAPALTWKDGQRHFAFWPHQVMASNLEDRTEAKAVLEEMIRTVNDTYERRDTLEPDHSARRRPTPRRGCLAEPGYARALAPRQQPSRRIHGDSRVQRSR